MPRSTRTVLVKPLNNQPLAYEVESWTNPTRPHVVMLSENHGNGVCTCTDFQTRRQPALDRGEKAFTAATMCRHIIAARNYFTNHMLRECSLQLNPKPRRHAAHR